MHTKEHHSPRATEQDALEQTNVKCQYSMSVWGQRLSLPQQWGEAGEWGGREQD